MKQLLIYISLCTILFAAGLGVSVVMDVGRPTDVIPPPPPVDLSEVLPRNPEAELLTEGSAAVDLPVPVHGKPLSAEELFRFGAMYRQQQEALAARQREVEKQQARLSLIRDDLAGSRKEFDGLREQIQDATQRATRVMQQLQEQREQLHRERLEAEDSLKKLEGEEKQLEEAEGDNVRKISSWFQSMPAEKAAEYLRELVHDGNIQSAVKLLENIEERNAAKILAAMEDAALVAELMEAFRNAKRLSVTRR